MNHLQEEFSIGFHTMCLNYFSGIEVTDQKDEDFINMFLKTKFYSYDCLPEVVRKNTDLSKNYLRPAFDSNKIFASDFRMFDKQNLIKFFDDIIMPMDGEYGNELRELWNKLMRILETQDLDKYFVIDAEWFDKEDIILNDPEYWVYAYYYLIIWCDRKNNKLTVCSWCYD